MDTIPVGLCQCGCGSRTKTAKRSDPRDCTIKGQPMRYIQGHSGGRPRRPDFVISTRPISGMCECGCGTPTPLSPVTTKRSGIYKGMPLRRVPGHQSRTAPVEYLEEDRGYITPCWIWQMRLTSTGYAMASRGGKSVPAYRVYWEERFGPMPKGTEPHHKCRVRSCVNPDHVEPVTHEENVQFSSGKLTPALVRRIRETRLEGATAIEAIAAGYGVRPKTIRRVVQGESWKNITIDS